MQGKHIRVWVVIMGAVIQLYWIAVFRSTAYIYTSPTYPCLSRDFGRLMTSLSERPKTSIIVIAICNITCDICFHFLVINRQICIYLAWVWLRNMLRVCNSWTLFALPTVWERNTYIYSSNYNCVHNYWHLCSSL